MSSGQSKQVRRRRVFYIPGYDPMHPRRYRELYRTEGAEQAGLSGYHIELKPKVSSDRFGWTAAAELNGCRTDTDFEVLVWSDIVKDSMSNTIFATYAQLFHTAWIYVASGTLWRLMKLRKGPVIAALYPVAVLLGLLVIGLLLAGLGASAGAALGVIGQVTCALLGLAIGYVLIRWVQARDGHYFVFYLMHDYSYSAQHKGANPPDLETRIARFADVIADALLEDVDEVLVVGHSSGAHIAVSVLADVLRTGRVPETGPELGFLSLGQVVPMVSFLPQANRLRADLQLLSTQSDVTWIDVTAPGDGCAFALCDPVAVSGVATSQKKWPLVLSAAFTQTLSAQRWKELRWRFFRLHFQYLCAFDNPGSYDYFQITAGPQTLAARFAGRNPSKSRIDYAVSKYTSVLAA